MDNNMNRGGAPTRPDDEELTYIYNTVKPICDDKQYSNSVKKYVEWYDNYFFTNKSNDAFKSIGSIYTTITKALKEENSQMKVDIAIAHMQQRNKYIIISIISVFGIAGILFLIYYLYNKYKNKPKKDRN